MRKLRVRFSVWTVAGSADRTTIVVPFCMLRFSSAQPSHKTLSGRHPHRSVVRSGPPPTCSAVLPRGTSSGACAGVPVRFGIVVNGERQRRPTYLRITLDCAQRERFPAVVNRGSIQHQPNCATPCRTRRDRDACGVLDRSGAAARRAASRRRHGRAPPKQLRTRRRF